MDTRQLTFMSYSPEQTEEVGVVLGRLVRAGDVLALEGELGAGKTALVRGVARGMGLQTDSVCSPTFVVMNEYASPTEARLRAAEPVARLIHVDAYRLSGAEDLDTLGWDHALRGDAVAAIEWPTRIAGALHSNPSVALVRLVATGAECREITILAPDTWSLRPEMYALELLAMPAAGPRACPACGRQAAADTPEFPFCSARCKLADLGNWFSERYIVGDNGPASE